MWARSSGSTVRPACFRCLAASPIWAVFQRRSASGTKRETGPRPGALRPGRSDGKDVLQYPRHFHRIRSRSHPHSHPLGHGHRPRQGEIARQAAQTVRQTAAGTLPLACQGRIFHQRSHQAFLRLKTNRLSHTQPAPFPLAYDPAPYRNRPDEGASEFGVRVVRRNCRGGGAEGAGKPGRRAGIPEGDGVISPGRGRGWCSMRAIESTVFPHVQHAPDRRSSHTPELSNPA